MSKMIRRSSWITKQTWLATGLLVVALASGFLVVVRPGQLKAWFTSTATVLQAAVAPAAISTLLLNSEIIVLEAATGQASIKATARDAAGQPVVGATVTFSSDGGLLSPSAVVTDERGEATAQFTAGATVGQAIVTATAGSVSSQRYFQIRQPQHTAQPENIAVTVSAAELEAGQAANIDVTVRNDKGEAVAGRLITIFATRGEVASASMMTNQNGQAQTTFTASNMPGQAQVRVMAGQTIGAATILVRPGAQPPTATPQPPVGTPVYLPVIQDPG